ncbi:MAG: hypothetical protein WAZ18_00250 [Alphaproteobacteria bacterium]
MSFMSKSRQCNSSTAGYTIDQTILIVAIIAILVTLIIISVGWQLINRTSGTKLASQFKQIEDANGSFYSSFRVWVDEAYTAPATGAVNNILALAGVATTWQQTVPLAQRRNFIPGFRINGTTNVQHNFSSGGILSMQRLTNPFGLTGEYFVVQFTGVPFSEVEEAESAIDAGKDDTLRDYDAGRVVASTGASCLAATVASPATTATAPGVLVTVCYAANLTQ